MNNFMLVVSLKKKIMLVDDFDLALDQSSLGRILCVCPHWSYPDPVTQTYPQESYAWSGPQLSPSLWKSESELISDPTHYGGWTWTSGKRCLCDLFPKIVLG